MSYNSCMIVDINQLANIRRKHSNKKIVLTSGTFDLFHAGHLHYLQAVKSYGDIVVVLLSGDARIKARKGASRPVIPEHDRAEILDALKVVDYVFIDPAQVSPGHIDPVHKDIIDRLQPDLYATDGDDVRFSSIMDKSRLIILPREDGGKHGSTTAIIEYIQSLGS